MKSIKIELDRYTEISIRGLYDGTMELSISKEAIDSIINSILEEQGIQPFLKCFDIENFKAIQQYINDELEDEL